MMKLSFSRNQIKLAAVIAMFLNHFAHVFLSPYSLAFEVLVDIGYFTAPTMCYFLVEGFEYTRDRRKYALRLLAGAFISQLPYQLALGFSQINMMGTLFLCFLLLWILDSEQGKLIKWLAALFIVLISGFFDWAIFAPLFTWMFYLWRKEPGKLFWVYFGNAVLFMIFNFWSLLPTMLSMALVKIYAMSSALGILVSGLVIQCFYNGNLGRSNAFTKWFFYGFYPLHLIVLVWLRALI